MHSPASREGRGGPQQRNRRDNEEGQAPFPKSAPIPLFPRLNAEIRQLSPTSPTIRAAHFATGFPSTSSTTTSPRFRAFNFSSILARSPTTTIGAFSGRAHFAAAAFVAASGDLGDAVGLGLELGERALLQPEGRRSCRRRWRRPRTPAKCRAGGADASSRAPAAPIGRAPASAFSSLSNSTTDSFVLFVCTPPPPYQMPPSVYCGEAREDAVGVALVLAQVQVQARAEAAAAADRVGEASARRSRRSADRRRRQELRDHRLRRVLAVDEVELAGGRRLRRAESSTAGAAPPVQTPNCFVGERARLVERHVADEDQRRASPASTLLPWNCARSSRVIVSTVDGRPCAGRP